MGAIVIVISYLMISVICVGMSFWSTYQGFSSEFGDLALYFAIVVTTGLFACDLVILERRSRGGRLWGVIFALTMFTTASLSANFHFFYKRFVGSEVAAELYQRSVAAFLDNMTKAETAVASQDSFQAQKQRILSQINKVEQETTDPSRPGVGPLAESYLAELRKMTDALDVPFAWPGGLDNGTAAKQRRAAIGLLRERIDGAMKAAEGRQPWRRVRDDITKARSSIAAPPLSGSSEKDAAAYLDAVRELSNLTLGVDRTLRQAFEQSRKDYRLNLKPVTTEDAQIIRISDSIRHGLTQHRESVYTWLAAAAAFLVDFLPLLFALAVVKPVKPNAPGEEAGEGRRKRRSTIPPILSRPSP